MTLPSPSPGRFKPLRCGLVELFLYEAQEFLFRDGRLLLRGDNGSGKSKVLALTLPLLLDANLAPARMEPDADPNKRMAWNLLMDDVHEERTGYSWVEFGRVDDEGVEHFVTLGLGVKAVRHKGVVRHWWFLTDQRIGDELHLVDRTRTVRTRERLIEAIGPRGTVFDTAERYRRAVDETLFGLHGRYGALVDLLVHLRQPQLSKRPDERQLAKALSEALPPMSDSLIDTVAQSYQALEDEERAVGRLRTSASSVSAFTAEYERYARLATARATVLPRRAQAEYEDQNRRARDAAVRLEGAREALAEAEADVSTIKEELARLGGARDALRERRGSDEIVQYTAARELAETKRAASAAAGTAHQRARAALDAAQKALQNAREDVEQRREVVVRERNAASAHALTAGVEIALTDHDPDTIARVGTAELNRRNGHLAHLDELLVARDAADAARTQADAAVDEAAARLTGEDERMRSAHDAAQEAASSWLDDVREHLGSAGSLRGDRLSEALEAAAEWAAVPIDGTNPLARWADETVRSRDAELEDERIAQEAELRRLEPLIAALDEEIAELAAGGVRRPLPPPARTARREDAPGAAFWECVDIRPEVPAESAAGIEAALEASGLLDAWVQADGVATAPDGDIVLRPAPQESPTLADVLVVAVDDHAVAAGAVEALLRSVALEKVPREGQIAVSAGGAFALGPLLGSWLKPAAEYLGATARDRARIARLEAAKSELELMVTERTSWEARGAELRERRAALGRERLELPGDDTVRRTSQVAAGATERRAEADRELALRRVRRDDAAQAQSTTAMALDEASMLYAIDLADLDAVRTALTAMPDAVDRLVVALREAARLEERERVYQSSAQDAAAAHAVAQTQAQDAAAEAVSAAERRDTLEATVGQEIREIEERLSVVEREVVAANSRHGDLDQVRQSASNEWAVAQDQLAGIEAAAVEAATAREVAAEEFWRFTVTGLVALAAPGVEVPDPVSSWAPDPTVRLARRLFDTVGVHDTSDPSWDTGVSRLRRAFETLQSELSTQGRQSVWDQQNGVTVVTIQHGSDYVAPEQLSAELLGELADRERLLTEKERAVLETHLIDEVGAQLHELVRDAMQQVNRMNDELARRPTRSGLKLRIVWEPADGDLDKEGRTLLQQNAAAWSPADREAIGEYLRSRISAARAENPDGSWHERLGTGFDYRAWNRFSVQLHQNGAWRPASGPASGGERVLAASVPLFAAASSHYASADYPHAPRLILLDEAFAGVDDRSRASYLGLLAEFDLDVVLTSEREWATYPEVPGIGISNLFRLPGTDAVHVEHWTWDGLTRERTDDPGMTAIEAAPSAEPGEESLVLDFGDRE